MVVIIGAGLSGLVTAYQLHKEGIPFKILEARNRVGGRIHTLEGANNTLIEMGATWFTADHRYLISLLNELGISYFEQYMDRSVFYQTSSTEPTPAMEIPPQSPSFRISGGSAQLINTLYQALNPEDVLLNQSVKTITRTENGLLITANEEFEAQKVVMAIPPKLWSNKIQLNPTLSNDLIQVAKHTHTWMENAIKVALTFNTPFWKEENIPASLFSNVGPVTEFYEHGNEKRSTYALCGFVNASFERLETEERKSLVVNQLKGVYGDRVKEFTAYYETVWSKEENTFVDPDTFVYPHQNNGNPIFRASFWEERLIISSSESASTFPGYMDGAINAGRATVEKIKQSL